MNYCLDNDTCKRDINNTHVVTFVSICRPNHREFKIAIYQVLIQAFLKFWSLFKILKFDYDLIQSALQSLAMH